MKLRHQRVIHKICNLWQRFIYFVVIMASVEGSVAEGPGQTDSQVDPQNGSVVATTNGSTENGQARYLSRLSWIGL